MSAFSYFISTEKVSFFENSICLGRHYLSFPDSTNVSLSSSPVKSTRVCIIGYCVDARGEIENDQLSSHLCLTLIDSGFSWSVLLRESRRLAGNFVVAVFCDDFIRLLNDATGRVGIYYHAHTMACSSSDALLAKYTKAELSLEASNIRLGSSGDGQPLPYNMTDYSDIFINLPNFYFDFSTLASCRYYPGPSQAGIDSLAKDEALARSYNLVCNIAKKYAKDYQLILPVTAGWDSRLNYSFFKNCASTETFTIKLPDFTDNTPDVDVPKLYLSNLKKHSVLARAEMVESLFFKVKREVTPFPSKGTFLFGQTLLQNYNNPVFISGDVIDQVGGSLIGQSLPEAFATQSFFKCKLHNFSKTAEVYLEEWIDSVGKPGFHHSLFDLFAWESRLGRWAHERNKIYSSMGVVSLNIYNCREVIELWTLLSRKKRSNMNIHRYYFKRNDYKILDIPFNPNDKLGWMKKNPLSFLIATYSKYHLDRIKCRWS